MTRNASVQELGEKIEQLVRDHVAEMAGVAMAAVQRALVIGKSTVAAKGVAGRPRAASQRRGPTMVADLADRFYGAVSETPGETMSVLAKKVGASPRELHRPVANLKGVGRVRSVGERQRTRYFPMAPGHAAT